MRGTEGAEQSQIINKSTFQLYQQSVPGFWGFGEWLVPQNTIQ